MADLGTRKNPKSITALKKYLCDKEGIKYNQKVFISDIEGYKNIKGVKLSSLYIITEDNKVYSIQGCNSAKGGKTLYQACDKNKNYIEFYDKSIAESVFFLKHPKLKDFKTEVKKAGKLVESEGGGWYCHRQLFLVDGVYYA